MGSVTHPRGRLPRRVYWVRRALVLAVALLLVFGIGRLVGGTGEDDPSDNVTASNTSAQAQRSRDSGVAMGPVVPSKKLRTKVRGPLLAPSGDCLADEINVLPSVPVAHGGSPITVRLQLQGTQPACSFEVSPQTVVVKITSGKDRIWSSQDCPRSVPTTEVVVRSGMPVAVPVTWSGRRSDDQCTAQPAWVLPGFYHVHAAALGSVPTDVQFEVTSPGPRTVTRTPRPRPGASATPRVPTTVRPSATARPTASAKPSARATTRPKPTARGTATSD